MSLTSIARRTSSEVARHDPTTKICQSTKGAQDGGTELKTFGHSGKQAAEAFDKRAVSCSAHGGDGRIRRGGDDRRPVDAKTLNDDADSSVYTNEDDKALERLIRRKLLSQAGNTPPAGAKAIEARNPMTGDMVTVFAKGNVVVDGDGQPTAFILAGEPKTIWPDLKAGMYSSSGGGKIPSGEGKSTSGVSTGLAAHLRKGEPISIPSTSSIVRELTSLNDTKEIALAIKERAEQFVDSDRLLSFIEDPRRGGPSIGMLTIKAIMQRYEQKYSMYIAHIGSPLRSLHEAQMNVGIQEAKLEAGNSVYAMIGNENDHMVPIVLKKYDDKLYAFVLNSLGDNEDYFSFIREAFQPTLERWDADMTIVAHKDVTRQSDESSCGTDALTMLKDIHRSAPNLLDDYESGEPLPSELLRTTQRPEFLRANEYDSGAVYRPEKGRAVGQHREQHTVNTTDQGPDRNKFLHAKALQFAMRTLATLESFGSKSEAVSFIDSLLPKQVSVQEDQRSEWVPWLRPEMVDIPRRRHFG